MAKREEPKPSKSKMTFVLFQLEGGDETLQQSFRAIGQALQSGLQQARALPAKPIAGSQPERDIEAEVVDAPAEDATDEPDSSSSDQPSKPARVRKPASYSFVKDLSFMPEGKPTLRDFYTGKAPKDAQEKVTVVLYYITRILGKTGVGSNHIYHGLKDVNVPIPGDIAQTARLTSSRKGWIDSSKSDDLKVTVGGENFVEHDLPHKAAK